jgi:hypothetical protein
LALSIVGAIERAVWPEGLSPFRAKQSATAALLLAGRIEGGLIGGKEEIWQAQTASPPKVQAFAGGFRARLRRAPERRGAPELI